MSLDTQTKRRSMIAIPGIGTLPVADLSIDSSDRRHFVDVFAAFPSVVGTFFFWRKTQVTTPHWKGEGAPPATPFISEKHQNDSWVKDVAPAATTFITGTAPVPGWVPDQDNAEE